MAEGVLNGTETGSGVSHRRSSAVVTVTAALSSHASDVRRAGSAALDLAYVACGRLDGFWELHLEAWDVAVRPAVDEQPEHHPGRADQHPPREGDADAYAPNAVTCGCRCLLAHRAPQKLELGNSSTCFGWVGGGDASITS